MTDDTKSASDLASRYPNLNFALTDAPVGESDISKAQKAEYLGSVYMDLLKRAQEPTDPNRPDDQNRAEACYFSSALTGTKDAYGTMWRKGGFKTGAEYLSFMKDFVRKSPEENKTQALKDFEALDEKGQEEAALAANRWTLDNASEIAGNAFGYAMDRWVRPNTTHRAEDKDVAAANYDLRDAAYRKKVRADHYAKLLADNAWIELSSLLPRMSDDGRACTEALMKSKDNALPESMYAKFNNLPDEEKQLLVRARTVLKPNVEGGFWNMLGDMAIGAANVGLSVATAPVRFGNKLFASGNFYNGLDIPFIGTVDADFFDLNEIARRRNYLWQMTGNFAAGGDGDAGALPQMQFEQLCENHGVAAEAIIGAISTLPYMAAAAIPGIGMATVAMEAMNEMDDHVVMQGGDITDPDYLVASGIFGGLYAYTERLQVEKLLGGVSDMKLREAMLKGFFHGIKSRTALRNLTVGTLSESVQEGLQNGIMSANEALALDQDATAAFGKGFVQDFVGSLGTMFIVEGTGLVGGHWKRSGYTKIHDLNNPFTSAGRLAGQQARSTDLETEYRRFQSQDRMVEYSARSQEAQFAAGLNEAVRLEKIWSDGGKDALIANGIDPVRAEEFDYFYRSAKDEIVRDEETGEEAMDLRRDKAHIAITEYLSEQAAAAAKKGEAEDVEAFAAAMTNMDWVRSAWAQGAGIRRTNEDGSVTDPGAKALESLGFTPEVADRLSRYFGYERAAAYSNAALAGIKQRYEQRMAGKVTAKAALAKQFGGTITRFDGAEYLTFTGKDGSLSLVRIDETPGGVDFSKYDEGIAVGVERETKGKITKADWEKMSPEERKNTWNDNHLISEGYFVPVPKVSVTLPADPSAKLDSAQAATIIGEISLDSNTVPGQIADTARAFHETFHAFSYFAQASGIWTKDDIAYLVKVCGDKKHSRETFDEEEGAEQFRSFLARYAAGALTAEDERGPFMKIYAAAAGLDTVAKENAAKEKIANENETAFFQQLIAEANKPKPKPHIEKPTVTPTAAPQTGLTAGGRPKVEGGTKEDDSPVQSPTSNLQPVGQPQTSNLKPSTSNTPQAWSAYTPTGNIKVSGYWAVLNLEDVIHSNNPLYAVHMRAQLRNRKDNKAEEDTRKDIVNNFQGERLLDAPDTANGAPIVFYALDDKGVNRPFVLSGNGRVLVLNELAERHLYDRYRNVMKQWAADHGIFVPEGQTPILVRVIDDYGGATRDKVADLSNTNSIQQYTEEEQARADAEVIKSLNIARLYVANADGSADMTPGVNDEFFAEFVRGVGDTSLYNSDRSLTQTARDRAQRALLAIAVGQGERGRDVVKKLVEQTETLNIQRQKNAAMIMAASVAALESNAAYAIGPDVSRAMADFMDYAEKRKAGKIGTFDEYERQEEMLDQRSFVANEILKLLGSDKAAPAIAEYVKAYCKAAAMEDPAGGLFGAARTKTDIWNDAKRFVDETLAKQLQAPAPTPAAPAPVLKQGSVSMTAPASAEPPPTPRGTDTFTVETKQGSVTATIPSGAYSGLRGTYDPYVETPASPDPVRSIFSGTVTRQNDPQGRYWGDKMPQFMGHKTEMFDRTVLTLRQKFTPAELAQFDTVVDYFGGGGSWGTSLALATLPNVKRIIVNEFDPGRAKKIELLQTRGEKLVDDVQKMFDANGLTKEIKRIAATAGDDGGETGSGATIANIILRNVKPKIKGDIEKLGLMYAFTDCASRQLAGSRDVRDPNTGEVSKVKITFAERWQKVMEQLKNDARNASLMRQEIEKRGGTVEYVNGDSTKDDFGVGFKTPHGANVMAVADPPYYRTEGYSDDGSSWKVGLESEGLGYAYADTEKMLKRLVDNGDGIVYTDEAWWLKPEYLESHRVQTGGLFDDSAILAQSHEFRRENEVLGNIRNMLDHFDVAGRVAKRYETLGVHHGGKKNGNDRETGMLARRDDIGVAHDGRTADEQGTQDHRDTTVQGLAGGAEGEDQPGLRSGGDSGPGSGSRASVRTEDVVRDIYASVEDAAIDAGVGEVSKAALENLTRRSVRQVREDRQREYADMVSGNAKRWLKDAQRKLDAHMAAHGYTEKVWRLTEGDAERMGEPGYVPVRQAVYVNPKDRNDFKAADPVTFMDDTDGALPIPLEMRADQSLADVRFSVTMGRRAREEARAMIEKYRPGVMMSDGKEGESYEAVVDRMVDQIASFDTPKERKAALYWFCKSTIRLPEDAPKVRDAIKTAERVKVDPFQFDRPGDILEQYSEFIPKEPPINPDTVPELSDRRDMGHGIVTYLVQDDREGQAAMRRVLNTHFGKDASPWCLLQGDKDGNLTDAAWHYWQYYNALPKRVAFHNGHLVAFMATKKGVQPILGEDGKPRKRDQWWDRADAPHTGIPFTRSVPSPSGEGATATEHDELLPDGTTRVFKTTRGDPKAKNGTYEEWKANGDYHKVVKANGRIAERIRREGGVTIEEEAYTNDAEGRNTERLNIYRDFNGKIMTAVVEDEYKGYLFSYTDGVLSAFSGKGNSVYDPRPQLTDDEITRAAHDIHDAAKSNDQPTVDAIVADLKARADKTPAPRFSVRTAWRDDFPKAVAQTTRANIMAKYADLFNRAKAGDSVAAADLIEKVVKPEKVRELVKGHDKATIVMPIHAEEATGDNKLPIVYAKYISNLTGLDYDDGIVQSVRANHTGAGAEHRLFVNPEFDGEVKRGREYIIVDDHITQGGTVNAMRDYIESNGGKVVAVSALTLSQGSSILSPRKDTLDEIKRKWPDIDTLLRTAGIADRVEALTESQCRYIQKFSADTFRARCLASGREGGVGVLRPPLGTPPSEGVAREETEADRAAMRHSVFVGSTAVLRKAVERKTLDDAVTLFHEQFHDNYTPKARNEIYSKTGWWRGTDGKWRFEIQDVKPKKRGDTDSSGYTVNGLHEYADRPEVKWCPLTDMVSNTKLFKAYPKLKDITVDIVDPDSVDFNAQYDPNRNRITINWGGVKWYRDGKNGILAKPSNVLNDDGLSSITHELQHAVQYIEDFAKGGSPEYHGERNYGRLAGEVEARNAEFRMGHHYANLGQTDLGTWDKNRDPRLAPWKTEDIPTKLQIIADAYGAMTDYYGNPVARHSVRRMDTEADARRAIVARWSAEGNKAANDALENYVAYFKLSHGSIPRPQTLARIGLSLGMNVVDPKRILKNAERLAEEMRGTLVEQASKNGDVATAMTLITQQKNATQKLDELIAGGVTAGGKLTHKGVGQINTILQRRVETMMRGFSAATLADMEGDTGIDLAAEILSNNPDAFETEYRKAKAAADQGEEDNADAGEGSADAAPSASFDTDNMSDADKYKREQLLKRQAERVATFIEQAKKRAEENGAKAAAARERRRVIELQGGNADGGSDNAEPLSSKDSFLPSAPDVKADFKTPEEFAAFLRIWARDKFAKTHGLSTLGKAQEDKLFAEFYRICVRQELQDLADKLLAPQMINGQGETVTNPRLAKLGNGARVWVNRRIAAMEKGIRPDTIERMSADIFAFINKAAVRVSRVDLINTFKERLRGYFKGPEFDEMKEDTERKVTGWVEESARYIAYVCDLSRRSANGDTSQLEKEYQKLHAILDERAKVYDESGADVANAAKEDAETLKAQWKLALLDKYGAMRSMMPGEILDLQNAAFDHLDNEAAKLDAAWKDRREQQDIVRRDFAGAIVGPGDQRYDAGKGLLGWLDKTLLDSLNGLLRLRLEHLTRFAPDDLKTKAKDAVNAILVMLGDGETAYAKALQQDREAFFEILGNIFKKPNGSADNKAIKKYLERMDEPIPPELARKLSNQGYAHSMTYGQMLQLLVSLEQRSFKDTIAANGRDGQADLIRSFRYRDEDGNVQNAFTKEDDAFVNALRGFYAANRDRLSEVTVRMVGHKVESPDPLYCPIRRFIDDKKRDLHSDPTQRWDPISRIFSRRVPSTRDFDESRTIVGLFFENSKESAKLTAWAERGSFIRNVVTSVAFQTAVKRAFGPGELAKILKQLEATFNGGEQRSQTPGEVAAADKAVNFVTYAYLGFNPLSALKQSTSFSVWANQLPNGFADLWRHMTHVDRKVIKHLMESDEYKVRYGNKVGSGMDYATKGLNMNPSTNPVMRAISGAGMWMLQRGDFAPGAWIAQGVYKDLLDKHMKEGMDFDAADRLAITETFNMLEETQQSGRTYNTNMLQIEHGRIGRLLTQFATSPLQQLQYETQALREWRDMVRYQMGKDKVAAARSKYLRAFVINHVIIPAALNFVIAAYKAALGEEPPWEKDGYHWTLLIDVLLGQFSRVFFLGAFAQTTLNAIFKRETPRAGQMLPIEGALGIAATIGITVHDLATMDVDKLQKDLERAMKATAPTRIPYNLMRRLLGDSDQDRKRKERERRRR